MVIDLGGGGVNEVGSLAESYHPVDRGPSFPTCVDSCRALCWHPERLQVVGGGRAVRQAILFFAVDCHAVCRGADRSSWRQCLSEACSLLGEDINRLDREWHGRATACLLPLSCGDGARRVSLASVMLLAER